MRTLVKNHSVITLSILLITGVLIAGWALAFHYESKLKKTDTQKELKSASHAATEKHLELDHYSIIRILVCVGLIGFFGVRRQSKKLENYVKIKQPANKASESFSKEKEPARQACCNKKDVPQECFLNIPCSI